jgi:hypothetical protein
LSALSLSGALSASAESETLAARKSLSDEWFCFAEPLATRGIGFEFSHRNLQPFAISQGSRHLQRDRRSGLENHCVYSSRSLTTFTLIFCYFLSYEFLLPLLLSLLDRPYRILLGADFLSKSSMQNTQRGVCSLPIE